MLGTVYWNEAAEPKNVSLDRLLYDIRRDDAADGLIFDAVTEADILEDPETEAILSLDALTSPYSKLERKMQIMLQVMERSSGEVKPVSMQLSKPFKNRGVANVAAIFELSDGQTISIYFHNPDSQPSKLAPKDEMISWKWLLNKKDITIVVAPEHGEDLNVREVARRVMKLAEKNSAAFQRANARRAERMQKIADMKNESGALEKELAEAQATLAALETQLSDAKIKLSESETNIKAANDELIEGREKLNAEKKAFEEEQARREAEKEAARKAAEEAEAARKAAEEAAAKKNEQPHEDAPQPEGGDQPQETDKLWIGDNHVLQQVIDGTHPLMDDPGLANILTEIYGRWESDPEKSAIVNQAIDAWANHALKATENLV